MGSDRVTEAGLLALAVATHVPLFAALFALIGVVFGEGRGSQLALLRAGRHRHRRRLAFSPSTSAKRPGRPRILNNYALTAFLTAALSAGLVYWLFSGRYVTGRAGRSTRA